MSQHKCENTQKTSAPEPTPSQCQCTTDHKNHQNYIPDSSLGLFFNLTLLFAELGKNTYAWANRGKIKNRIAILSAQWVAWENRKSWGFLGCQTPTDGNVAPLTPLQPSSSAPRVMGGRGTLTLQRCDLKHAKQKTSQKHPWEKSCLTDSGRGLRRADFLKYINNKKIQLNIKPVTQITFSCSSLRHFCL